MSENRFELLDETIFDNQKQAEGGGRVTYWVVEYQQRQELVELLNELHEENYELKQQLLYDDDVCSICKHEYLTPNGDYYTSKCEKGHEECSKKDIKYCEDFKLKGDLE